MDNTGDGPNDNTDKKTAQTAEVSKEWIAQELYDLADRVMEARLDPEKVEGFRADWAAKRMDILAQVDPEGILEWRRSTTHDWILETLEYLVKYCDREGLDLLSEFFTDARVLVFALLKNKA
ncbi:hypothetical protein RGUI_0044 (plasmid) [Rhodovulum sp. P5]|nr:hypothetical protein RGUI_0044 [Rhodovulum sp. P5]